MKDWSILKVLGILSLAFAGIRIIIVLLQPVIMPVRECLAFCLVGGLFIGLDEIRLLLVGIKTRLENADEKTPPPLQ